MFSPWYSKHVPCRGGLQTAPPPYRSQPYLEMYAMQMEHFLAKTGFLWSPPGPSFVQCSKKGPVYPLKWNGNDTASLVQCRKKGPVYPLKCNGNDTASLFSLLKKTWNIHSRLKPWPFSQCCQFETIFLVRLRWLVMSVCMLNNDELSLKKL